MKDFTFGIAWEEYGHATVEVPDDYTLEQAKEYVLEHWNEIPLPTKHDYVEESDEPDFEFAKFT